MVTHEIQVDSSDVEYYVDRVVGYRFNRLTREDEYLIRWYGYSREHDMWLPERELDGCREAVEEFKIQVIKYADEKLGPILQKSRRTYDSSRKTSEYSRKAFDPSWRAPESLRKAADSSERAFYSSGKTSLSSRRAFASPRRALESSRKAAESSRVASNSSRKTSLSSKRAFDSPRRALESSRSHQSRRGYDEKERFEPKRKNRRSSSRHHTSRNRRMEGLVPN
ncbi:hypothetical protein AB6A40_001584 [Gnathostoma spinigerum]|uniref:Chromo domain-containing protein n=1 Tax=Gnathostoma spinigerum TaxID=75299 RepID=A0ABD6E5I3_9BILA